ncbi:MAG: carbohydrate kinase family protein [Candidatus Blackburnbacteria bacterium]|nr:carbohydrate kinase family protein [Candidatus Blackburnbacteria bacterium]
MQEQFDLISIGDSTIDLFMEVDVEDAHTVCTLDNDRCVVCFGYGSKVPVKKMTRVAAVGNAANSAIGSSRLGLKTAIYTVIGSDQDSQEMRKIFKEEDVDTSFVVMESGKRSNLSVVLNYNSERTIFVYHEDRNYNLPKFPGAKWIYYTSVAKGHDILHKQVPEYIRSSGAKLAFNPGSYQLREGPPALAPILEITEVLLLNREEAHFLVGGDLEDAKGLIAKLKRKGPQIVVMTDGKNGSFASFDGREVWHVGIPQDSPVLEMTGAGDAYSTGFLAALAQGTEIPEAMVCGTMNATSVVQYVGAREGLLTPQKMQEFMKEYGQFVKPKMI